MYRRIDFKATLVTASCVSKLHFYFYNSTETLLSCNFRAVLEYASFRYEGNKTGEETIFIRFCASNVSTFQTTQVLTLYSKYSVRFAYLRQPLSVIIIDLINSHLIGIRDNCRISITQSVHSRCSKT